MNLPDLKVLIAEDNIVNQKVISFPFIKNNIIPKIANDGKIALEMFKEEHFNLILMDINMPVMDGISCTKAIRKLSDAAKANIPIIAITGNYENFTMDDFKKAGLDDYVQKPLDYDLLLSTVKKHIFK